MSSASVIAKQLTADQCKEIALNLLDSFTSSSSDHESEYVTAFDELVSQVPDVKPELYDRVFEYCKSKLICDDEDSFDSVLKLCHIFTDKLEPALVEEVATRLTQNGLADRHSFNTAMFEYVTPTLEHPQESEMDVGALLHFLEWLFLQDQSFASTYTGHYIDRVCLLYLTHDNEKAEQLASQCLRWRINSLCEDCDYLWNGILALLAANETRLTSYAHILWMRMLNHFGTSQLAKSTWFQALVSRDIYWTSLRDGLLSTTHEHRKFALVLLQQSIQSLSTEIDLPVMRWTPDRSEQELLSWKRFSTLYTIIGIDTSINQASAASNDLVQILSPDSDIPFPFAVTILSIGFNAPTERVKTFTLDLSYMLPDRSVQLFKYDLDFLTGTFLPFAMQARHFGIDIRQTDGFYECKYGGQLEQFVSKIVRSFEDEKDITRLLSAVFQILIDNPMSYGPARIFVLAGLLNGLESSANVAVTDEIIPLLCKLFSLRLEAAIWHKFAQTLLLKFLLHTNVDPSVIFYALGEHVRYNGFDIYYENEEFFLDFLNTSYNRSLISDYFESGASKKLHLYAFILLTSYLLTNNVDPTTLATQVLARSDDMFYFLAAESKLNFQDLLMEPKIVEKVGQLVGRMLSDDKTIQSELYDQCELLLNNKELFTYEFWTEIKVEPLFEKLSQDIATVSSYDDASYTVSQFYFLSVCADHCRYNEGFAMAIEELITCTEVAFQSVSRSNNDTSFYKFRDRWYGIITSSISKLLPLSTVEAETKANVIALSEKVASLSHSPGHRGNIDMLNALLESTDVTNTESETILHTIGEIWEDLIRDRLMMHERPLHHKFIRLLLHRVFLKQSATNPEIAESIQLVANQIIKNSYGRKSLLPTFFKALSDYQVYDTTQFGKTLWLGKLLVNGAVLYQNDDSVFEIDMALSDLYDTNYNLGGMGLYEQVYGDREVSYQVYLKVVVGSINAEPFTKGMWSYIMDEDQFHLLHINKRTDHREQWKRLQLLEILLETFDAAPYETVKEYVMEKLLSRILMEASPLCRSYIEWIVALAIFRFPDLKGRFLAYFKPSVDEQVPKAVTTFERIVMLVALQQPKVDEITQFLVDTVIPSATSNRSTNRHFSVSMACVIRDLATKHNLALSEDIKHSLDRIQEVAEISDSYGKFRVGDAFLWSFIADLSLCGLNGGVLMKISDRYVTPIMEKTWRKYISRDQFNYLRIPIGHDQKDLWIPTEGPRDATVKLDMYEEDQPGMSSILQTKSGAWETVMDPDSDGRAASKIKRSPLIVMASLVDKAPNLGGICRLCDCLGAGWMTMDNLEITKQKEFLSVAMTADRWEPLLEVKIRDIVEFLRLKKVEGYTLVGLEQTDNSVELNSELKFPVKSLIVLGKEREGIPAEILAELDMCVIIKQTGVVRSMNIQTATAVIVQAYSAQHC